MVGLIVRRLSQLTLVLVGISFFVFISMHIPPGDPAVIIGGKSASSSDLEAIREDLGLNRPVLIQYFDYLGGILHGDLGYSFQANQSVAMTIITKLPNTLKLVVASLLVAIVIGVSIGIVSVTKQKTWLANFGKTSTLIGISVPNFLLGTMLIFIFSIHLHWFPVSGITASILSLEGLKQLVLPAISLGTASAALFARVCRPALSEVITVDNLRLAKIKGIKGQIIIWGRALRNTMIPLFTVIGVNFGTLLGGTIITEQVFAINGVGKLIIDAIVARDLPVVQGTVFLLAAMFLIVNFIVGIVYAFMSPRISIN